MYILPKFLSKIIKKYWFILISPSGQKFIIGEPKKKDDPLEVKVSKKVSVITKQSIAIDKNTIIHAFIMNPLIIYTLKIGYFL